MKLPDDILLAGAAIQRFTQNMTEADDHGDERTRRAVERDFEIVGEAMRRLAQEFPDTLSRISSAPRIIAFRNVLAHGYDAVEDPVVWSIVEKRLPALLREAQALMNEERGHA